MAENNDSADVTNNNNNNTEDDVTSSTRISNTPTTTTSTANQVKIEYNIKKQMMASIIGGMVTSLVVTPLDVVKTRLQTQVDPTTTTKATATPNQTTTTTTKSSHKRIQLKGTMDAFYKITKYEGVFTLWRGLTPSLLMTIPSATIDDTNLYTVPLISGCVARIISATVTSPFELLRTNSQGITKQNFKSLNLFKDIVNNVGWRGLWRGLSPTLLRDVPFSAIYWSGYELIKDKIMRSKNKNHTRHNPPTFFTSFIAGATSGTIAAIVTTPIDVVKTRIQMTVQQQQLQGLSTSSSSFKTTTTTSQQQFNFSTSAITNFKNIIQQEGWMSLTKGMVPRVAKVSPACAIMVSTYEWVKSVHWKN
eukprot:gene1201-1514_t